MHKEMIGHVCAAATSEHDASAHLSNDSHESCSGVGCGLFDEATEESLNVLHFLLM